MLEIWVIFCCFFENLLVIYCTAITSIASKPGKRSCACCRNSIMSNVTQAGCQQRVHQANSVNLDEPLTLAEDLAETVDSNGKKLWAVWQSLCTLLAEESTQHQTCTALKSLWNACTSDFFHLVGPWPKPDHHSSSLLTNLGGIPGAHVSVVQNFVSRCFAFRNCWSVGWLSQAWWQVAATQSPPTPAMWWDIKKEGTLTPVIELDRAPSTDMASYELSSKIAVYLPCRSPTPTQQNGMYMAEYRHTLQVSCHKIGNGIHSLWDDNIFGPASSVFMPTSTVLLLPLWFLHFLC